MSRPSEVITNRKDEKTNPAYTVNHRVPEKKPARKLGFPQLPIGLSFGPPALMALGKKGSISNV